MAVLFTDLDSRDSNQIVAQLQATGVRHKVTKDGTQIRVPQEEVNQLRLSLAQQGIPASGSIGYELFDREQSIGTSSFVQNINRVRALEGELARTIAGFQSVHGARVHLVLPRRELFSRQQVEPSASVILRMRGAVRLDSSQIKAVQHLVANAVPSLTTGRTPTPGGPASGRGRSGAAKTTLSEKLQIRVRRRTLEDSMVEGLIAAEKPLREELAFVPQPELIQRARAAGVDGDTLEKAIASANRAALISSVVKAP